MRYDGGHGHFHNPAPAPPRLPQDAGVNMAPGSLPAFNQSWAQRMGMSGADVMNHWNSLHPNAMPRLMQGNYQGPGGIGGSHTFMTYDSNGNIVPIAEQNGLQGQAGKLWGRPTDPMAAAAYDHFMRMGGPGRSGPVGFGGNRGGLPGTGPQGSMVDQYGPAGFGANPGPAAPPRSSNMPAMLQPRPMTPIAPRTGTVPFNPNNGMQGNTGGNLL
jgi:hypothetical protein